MVLAAFLRSRRTSSSGAPRRRWRRSVAVLLKALQYVDRAPCIIFPPLPDGGHHKTEIGTTSPAFLPFQSPSFSPAQARSCLIYACICSYIIPFFACWRG
jgi:hypothetical protein